MTQQKKYVTVILDSKRKEKLYEFTNILYDFVFVKIWNYLYKYKNKYMTYDFSSHLVNFEALSLAELNATASFLKRIDTKFLLTKDQFMQILHELKEDFRVLEIS